MIGDGITQTLPVFPEKDPALRARLERVLDRPVERIERIRGGGYTPALRLRVVLRGELAGAESAGAESVFIKYAASDLTAGWLETEYQNYRILQLPCMPRLIAWDPAPTPGDYPLLVLEDLSAAHWPPPWTPDQIARVRAMLDDLAIYPTAGLETVLAPLSEDWIMEGGWKMVAANPEPFLSLGLSSRGWLKRCLPALIAAGTPDLLRGSALLHSDMRSDNICLLPDRVVLVDWNMACLGNPRFDFASWLPSLETEGGPAPDTLLPDGAGYAALFSGFFAARAGLPLIPDAPFVRQVQQKQLASALPWAIRALRLPELY